MAKNINGVNVYVYYIETQTNIKFNDYEQRTIANQYGATSNYVIGSPGPAGDDWRDHITARVVYRAASGATRYYRARMYIPASAGYSHWYSTVSSAGGYKYSSWNRSSHVYGADPSGNGLYNQGDCCSIYYSNEQDETHDDQPYSVYGYWYPRMSVRNYFASTTTFNYRGTLYFSNTSHLTLSRY